MGEPKNALDFRAEITISRKTDLKASKANRSRYASGRGEGRGVVVVTDP